MQEAVRVRSTAQIAGHPIHPMLVPIPIACFIGALVTDIAYVVSAEIMASLSTGSVNFPTIVYENGAALVETLATGMCSEALRAIAGSAAEASFATMSA